MIEEEDSSHPLTDEQITERLQSEGIQVTRRTVAKYREDMRIPSTSIQRRVPHTRHMIAARLGQPVWPDVSADSITTEVHMKITYRGMPAGTLPPKLQEKLDSRFAKLSKLLERRGEKEAHVVVTAERRLHKTEITIPFYDHQLIGLGSDADLFTVHEPGAGQTETQAVENPRQVARKRRDAHRRREQGFRALLAVKPAERRLRLPPNPS